MTDLNSKLCRRNFSLGTDWQELSMPMNCTSADITADVSWLWCTDIAQPNAAEEVLAGISYPILVRAFTRKDSALCWIKSSGNPGTMWITCRREQL